MQSFSISAYSSSPAAPLELNSAGITSQRSQTSAPNLQRMPSQTEVGAESTENREALRQSQQVRARRCLSDCLSDGLYCAESLSAGASCLGFAGLVAMLIPFVVIFFAKVGPEDKRCVISCDAYKGFRRRLLQASEEVCRDYAPCNVSKPLTTFMITTASMAGLGLVSAAFMHCLRKLCCPSRNDS